MHDGFSDELPDDTSNDGVEHVTQRESGRQASRQQEACELMERLRDVLAENDYSDCEDRIWLKRIWEPLLYRGVRVKAYRLQKSTFLAVHKQEVFVAERQPDTFSNTLLMRQPEDKAGTYVDVLRSAHQRLSRS